MKITNEMINEELRPVANLIEKLLPSVLGNDKNSLGMLLNQDVVNPEELIKNLNLDDETMKLLTKSGMMSLIASMGDLNGLEYTEKWIPRKKDSSKLRICIYSPINKKNNVPGVLWMHGGGYAMGKPEMSVTTYKRLIAESSCVIVAPDYRLSVEAPYPAALDDCYDTLLWLKENTKELGIRDDQIMIGGESAGGGLTAALSLYARDKKEVNIAFQMPLYPMIDDRMLNESAIDNNAPGWNSTLNEWGWKLYLGELSEKDIPSYAAPSRATDYRNLPPTVTFVGDLEPFRDETIQYVENLKRAGVPVDFQLYKGCYHGFDISCPNADISKRATKFFIESFKYAVNNYFAKQIED